MHLFSARCRQAPSSATRAAACVPRGGRGGSAVLQTPRPLTQGRRKQIIANFLANQNVACLGCSVGGLAPTTAR